MRGIRVLIAVLLVLIMSFYCTAYAADDIVIDVDNGHLKTGSYNIKLDPSGTPISIGLEGGNVIVTVLTDTGDTMRLNLGPGRVALTKRANPFVVIEQGSTTAKTGGGVVNNTGLMGTCKACGKPLSSGDHTKLRCGHYVCKVGEKHFRTCPSCNQFMCNGQDHTPCPACGVGFCNHDNNKCSYMHNPAPTPFQTTNPDGKLIYFYLSPDGVFMLGNPAGTKGKVWSPALEWRDKYYPTPSPTPTATPRVIPGP